MKLTEPAKDAILEVMQRQQLDPEIWYLEFRLLENGAIGLGFTQDNSDQILEFGDLKLSIDETIDTEGVMVDYGKLEGKQGLYFGPEPSAPSSCGNCSEDKECCGGSCDCNGECGENCKCEK